LGPAFVFRIEEVRFIKVILIEISYIRTFFKAWVYAGFQFIQDLVLTGFKDISINITFINRTSSILKTKAGPKGGWLRHVSLYLCYSTMIA
jgi:hypothetical protein